MKTVVQKGKVMLKGTIDKGRKLFLLCLLAVLPLNAYAGGGGLSGAAGLLQTLQDNLMLVIPIFAIIALIIIGIGYALRMLEKDTMVRWLVGILVAGSAAELTAMLLV